MPSGQADQFELILLEAANLPFPSQLMRLIRPTTNLACCSFPPSHPNPNEQSVALIERVQIQFTLRLIISFQLSLFLKLN